MSADSYRIEISIGIGLTISSSYLLILQQNLKKLIIIEQIYLLTERSANFIILLNMAKCMTGVEMI